MKPKPTSIRQLSFVLLALFCAAPLLHGQSTLMPYQGRLNSNAIPATGLFDMRFTVHDALSAGQLLSGPISANAVPVTNGLFSTALDFGIGVFTGPRRWLEIAVRPGGSTGSFTTLLPRQELTSSPYAIRAQTAGTAADVSTGSVVKSINGLKDAVTLAAGANVSIAPNGNTLTIASTGGGAGPWSLNGSTAYYTGGNVGIGTTTPVAKLDVAGTTRTCVLTIVGGCDLAEPFPIKHDEIPKGSVVVIDDEHAGRLMQSERAYDTRVAGIVSGANGVNPGITLQQEGLLDRGQNVALSGRVYVLADASQGPIKPGDLLTTSDLPGHAMKASDRDRAQGAILGKAMSALVDGQGMVLALVTLQ
jgi:hypothetical protein